MRSLLAVAMLTGCGAAQRPPTDAQRRALESAGHVLLRCDDPLRFVADPESMAVEECVEQAEATDVVSALACRRTEWVEEPIDGRGAFRVDGCGRSVVLVCGPDCDGAFACVEWVLVGRMNCATYRRG